MVFGIGGTIIALLALICAVLVIYDVLTKNRKLSDTAKIIWIICAILFSIITAIVYWLVEKK
jgi:hypothetical protein